MANEVTLAALISALQSATSMSLPKGGLQVIIDFDSTSGAGKSFELLRQLIFEQGNNVPRK